MMRQRIVALLKSSSRMCLIAAVLLVQQCTMVAAKDQGPFSAHAGLTIVRAYTSESGPDAEEYNVFQKVGADGVRLSYSDTRGIEANRVIRTIDRKNADVYLIGFDPKVPLVIPGTTSLGISSAALQRLRTTGQTTLGLMYDTKLSVIPGVLRLVSDSTRLPILIEDQIVKMPVLVARGTFEKGRRRGVGYFYFLSDQNQPIAIQYNIQFSWEKALRTIRTVRVSAGQSQQAAMEQTLRTIGRLDLYGIHFDFDKATIRPTSRSLVADIARTLKNNPRWKIEIRGHTDAIGKPEYNVRLSLQRAQSVLKALALKHNIGGARLFAVGVGMAEPKSTNETLAGRAQNRRVELRRTDR